jgi:hypothetical protein
LQLDLQKVSKRALLGMISEDLAISKGIQVGRTNLLLVSLIVAVGMKIVGTLLVGFLVIVPAVGPVGCCFRNHDLCSNNACKVENKVDDSEHAHFD